MLIPIPKEERLETFVVVVGFWALFAGLCWALVHYTPKVLRFLGVLW